MIPKWLTALHQFFFPQVCVVCYDLLKRSEESICLICEASIPILPYKFGDGNPIEQLFYSRVSLKGANAFLSFIDAGRTQKMIHAIKYQNRTELAYLLGKMAAENILVDSPYFKPDVIIPVPLHQSKLLKRGFNQSDFIAIGMANTLNSSIDTTSIKRVVATSSQTKKSRKARVKNVMGIFEVLSPINIKDRTILVIDDVITTGATIDSLCTEIQKYQPHEIYVYALAYKT